MNLRHATALAQLSPVWRNIYRGGPASLTVLVAAASIAYGATLGPCQRCSGVAICCSWGGDLVPLSWAAATVWHLALAITERGKRGLYLVYALVHLPVMLVLGVYSLGFITGDWL